MNVMACGKTCLNEKPCADLKECVETVKRNARPHDIPRADLERRSKPPSSYAPMYCALYPELVKVVREHGYALAVHGSLQRDMDLICVPWIARPSEPEAVVSALEREFSIRRAGGEPTMKEHGRQAWTISIGFGSCFIDLSFMPATDYIMVPK